jgi:NADH-quinone oxidoreductase subunit N
VLADRSTIVLLLPELILVAMATWIFVGGTITRGRTWWLVFSLATYAAAGFVMFRNDGIVLDQLPAGSLVGPLIIDPLGQGFRWLALLVGVLFTLAAGKTSAQELASEVFGTIMLIAVGLMLVSRANNLVLLFVSLELISIPTYVLLYLGRTERINAEATAKYFFLSVLSSAILLYGLSFLYGLSGVTVIAGGLSGGEDVGGIREALAALAPPTESADKITLLLLGLVLTFSGLAFKIAAVPFQFYAPDVYQGTSNLNAGLLATAPKIAGMLALVRLVAVAVPANSDYAWQVTMVVAVLTMTIGNVCALWQNNLRRLMAYSSIAHAGYMLIGLAVALAADSIASGVTALVVYLVVYVLAALGTFAALAYLDGRSGDVSDVGELAGLGRTQPTVAALLAVFLFSLAGIPPLAGFWGKLGLFAGAVRLASDPGNVAHTWFLALAILGALNAAVAAGYYLRVVGVMFFQPPAGEPVSAGGRGPLIASIACALLILVVGLVPSTLVGGSERAGEGLVRDAGQSSASTVLIGRRDVGLERSGDAVDARELSGEQKLSAASVGGIR